MTAPIPGAKTRAAKAQARRFAKARQALIDDVAELLEAGESPNRVAARVGYSKPASLARRLHRAGQHALAAKFEPAYPDRYRSRVPCKVGCGRMCLKASRTGVCRACVDFYGIANALHDAPDVDALIAALRVRRTAA